MGRELVFLRHGDAAHEAVSDAERVLTPEGRAAVVDVASKLKNRGIVIERALVSTAARTRETFDVWSKEFGFQGQAYHDKSLYLAASQGILELISCQPSASKSIVIIGHNPGLSDLTRMLTGKRVMLPPAGAAVMSGDLSRWSEIRSLPSLLNVDILNPEN